MAGLLGDVLPAVFSAGDRAKRYLGGLLSDPMGRIEQTLGQASDNVRQLGLLSQQAYGDKRDPLKVTNPQAAQQYNDAMFNMVSSFAPAGITVWHGSPYKFDKFDSSKIGTGEGAQAYGDGIYTAQSRDVAEQYAQSVKANSGELIKRGALYGLPEDVASNLAAALQSGKKFDPLIEAARKMVDDPLVSVAQKSAAQKLLENEMAAYNAWGEWSKPGHIYKVDLPDEHVAKMLDWDKPLSQQHPDVQTALQKSGLLKYADEYFKANRKAAPTGADLHDFLKYSGYDQGELAARMADQGIPGIRYLDGGSRGTGGGTSNFVVFPGNEGLLSILERNGQPLK